LRALRVIRPDLAAVDAEQPAHHVNQVAILFTDLMGSSALYQCLGDEAAYRLVGQHFSFLAGVIRDHRGIVVKTLGDALMAAFEDVGQAVQAAIAIQRGIGMACGDNSRQEQLVVRLGLHAGSAIHVNANGGQDYFGSVVNIAAQLRGVSQGRDLALCATIAADPAIAALLRDCTVTPGQIRLKGVAQPQPFCRIQP
jgi:class 3 adenylate cyclase